MEIPSLDFKKLLEQSPLQILYDMVLRKDFFLFSEIGKRINKLGCNETIEAKNVLSVNNLFFFRLDINFLFYLRY